MYHGHHKIESALTRVTNKGPVAEVVLDGGVAITLRGKHSEWFATFGEVIQRGEVLFGVTALEAVRRAHKYAVGCLRLRAEVEPEDAEHWNAKADAWAALEPSL